MMTRHRIKTGRCLLFFIFWGFISTNTFAQIEKLDKAEADKRIEHASILMYNGQYAQADEEFKFILDHAQSLNPDICYYFGVNSLFLKKYKQSINWLNKYLELKGSQGKFSDKCTDYLALAEKAYLKKTETTEEAPSEMPEEAKELKPDNYNIHNIIDCEKYGKIVCPVCKGKGVIIKEGLFGKEYNTCPYGDDYGYMSCEDYNLLMQGKLEPNK